MSVVCFFFTAEIPDDLIKYVLWNGGSFSLSLLSLSLFKTHLERSLSHQSGSNCLMQVICLESLSDFLPP